MLAGRWPLRCCEMFDYDCDRTNEPTDTKIDSPVNKLNTHSLYDSSLAYL